MSSADSEKRARELVDGALKGDVRSVSRLISLVENEAPGYELAYSLFYPKTGYARVIGITGPPGGGKSTLVDKFALKLREAGHKVGIIAVDPTSPFTGGAVLGDRVRMQRHNADSGVFIRSMGTRGHLGGLSRGTAAAVDVLDPPPAVVLGDDFDRQPRLDVSPQHFVLERGPAPDVHTLSLDRDPARDGHPGRHNRRGNRNGCECNDLGLGLRQRRLRRYDRSQSQPSDECRPVAQSLPRDRVPMGAPAFVPKVRNDEQYQQVAA